MMCIACEQRFIWLAYLESRGLIAPDNATTAPAPFSAFADKQSATPGEERAPDSSGENTFSCDDPTAG